MPRDKLLALAEEAGRAVEQCEPDPINAFGKAWVKNEERFSAVKLQYEKMLLGVPEDRASTWKQKMGIEGSNLDASNATMFNLNGLR